MKVFLGVSDYDHYAGLLYKDRRVASYFYQWPPGKLQAPEWETFEVVKSTDNGSTTSRNPVGNFARLEGSPNWVLDARAKEVLEPYLAPEGELLPLRYRSEPRWMFNCTNVIPAYDLDLCTVSQFSDGKINNVRFPVYFVESQIRNQAVFMPAECPMFIFVSEEVAKAAQEAKLTGFVFSEEWDSEAPVPAQMPVNTQFLHRRDLH
jgi:hypothetical protein